MIIFYACAVAFVALALVLRRRLRALARLQLHHVWLVWLALGVQVVVISVIPGTQHSLLDLANYSTYVLGACFAWVNRRTPGAAPLFLGGALNIAAITANNGTMPASKRALIASGWRPPPGHFANSAVVPHAHLAVLGDIFATPSWLPGHDVFSIGDILIVVGFVTVIWRVCTSRSDVEDPITDADARRHEAVHETVR